MADAKPTCGNCRWWHTTATDTVGYGDDPLRKRNAEDMEQDRGLCRRYAPCFHRTYWPETSRRDWCGEHAPMEAKDETAR